MQCRVLAVANQKGGVGKTATAITLAAGLAARSKRTLVIDLDPQANATGNLAVGQRTPGIAEVLQGEVTLREACSETGRNGLSLIAGGSRMATWSLEGRRTCPWRTEDTKKSFDFVILDCPPSISGPTILALQESDELIIPVQSEYLALEGLSSLLRAVDSVRGTTGTLQIRYLITMFDRRNNLSGEVEAELRAHFGKQVSRSVIPRSVRMAEAPGFRRTIFEHDEAGSAAQAYAAFTEEVLAYGPQ